MFYLSDKSKENMKGVDHRLIQIAERAIILTPIDFGIPEDGGVRTAERQRVLYNMGRSKCDGYIKESNHQSGLALDIYAYAFGLASWDKLKLCIVAGAMLQASCELGYVIGWGGLWISFQDMPHFELNGDMS